MELFDEKRLSILRDVRKIFIRIAIICGLIFFTLLYFVKDILQKLVSIINMKLILYSLPEAFMSYLKVAFFLSLLIIVPYIIFEVSKLLGKYSNIGKKFLYIIVISGTLLFYSGLYFCYVYVLPSGIKFLLQYQTEDIKPMIALSSYISFVFTFLLVFGIMFELPLIMFVLGRLGFVTAKFLNRQRRFFILINSIVSALLTPTPDVFNLMLMMIPMQILYEIGVVIVYFTGRENLQKKESDV